MTYRELSEALGVSLRAAEARARRHVKAGRWRHRIDNDTGLARVLVPPGEVEDMRDTVEATGALPAGVAGGDTAGDTVPDISALWAEVAEARERAARAEGEATALRSALDAERLARQAAEGRATAAAADSLAGRERLGRAEAERDAARIAQEAIQREMERWMAGGPVRRAIRALLHRR